VPISRYGDEPGGGTSEINQVESAAYHRDEPKKKILELEGNIAELERILHKLDRAMEGLGEQDKGIIKSYYIEGNRLAIRITIRKNGRATRGIGH